jgi:hypothetical protein
MKTAFLANGKLWVWMSVLSLGLLWLGAHAALTRAEAAATPTVTVLSPSGAAADTIGEGEDYFTQVLHDPRDMNQYTDMSWQTSGLHNISVANGVWSATTSNTNGYSEIFPLYPGFSFKPTGGSDDQSVAEIGKTGWNYPINASKYKQLSFRLKAPTDASAADNWWHASYTNVSFTSESGHLESDYIAPSDSWQVYVQNLPWNSPIYGLAFRFGKVTGNYQFDWLRLTDSTTSPAYTVSFSVAGVQSGDVVDLYCYTASQIVADNSCGQIAANIAVNTAGTYSYVWKTAYLPPDDYYVYAVVRRGAVTGSDVSNGPLTIKPAPLLQFDAPSMTSGPDFATEVNGDPWDMNDDDDIFTSADLYRKPHDFSTPDPYFANGELYGTVGRYNLSGQAAFSDPFVYLKVRQNYPIDTSKYKYLTYRYKIDRSPWWSNSGDRLAYDNGRQVYPAAWLVRAVFFGTFPLSVGESSNSTNDMIVFDEWNTYQLDLSKGVARAYWEPHVHETGGYWTGLKYGFRFDFLEGVDEWNIHLDYVKLTGDDTANASYTVRWSQLEGSDPTAIDFYRSQNPNACLSSGTQIYHWQPATGGSLPPAGPYHIYLPLMIGGGGGSAGPTSFVWNTSAVTPGTHYICGRVSDGVNTTTMVSQAAVIISH